MVDQLAMWVITVPMCLRPEADQGWASLCSFFCRAYNLTVILLGYPPTDVALRTWVLNEDINDQVAARKRLHTFMYALLAVTRTTPEDIESQSKGVNQLRPRPRKVLYVVKISGQKLSVTA